MKRIYIFLLILNSDHSIYVFYFESVKFYTHVHTTFCAGLYYFLRFEIQARNDEHDTTNNEHYKKVSRKEKEKFPDIFSRKVSYRE